MNTVPYYDVDNRLIAFLTIPKAEVYIRDGIATAVRSGKAGLLRRLYRKTTERIFTSAREVSFAANTTTRRILRDNGSAPAVREHRPAPPKPTPLIVINAPDALDGRCGMPSVSTLGYKRATGDGAGLTVDMSSQNAAAERVLYPSLKLGRANGLNRLDGTSRSIKELREHVSVLLSEAVYNGELPIPSGFEPPTVIRRLSKEIGCSPSLIAEIIAELPEALR